MSAKKKAAKDRHRSGFMVRLPEPYREALAELRRKTRRAITVETQIALDEHLKMNGITPPSANPGPLGLLGVALSAQGYTPFDGVEASGDEPVNLQLLSGAGEMVGVRQPALRTPQPVPLADGGFDACGVHGSVSIFVGKIGTLVPEERPQGPLNHGGLVRRILELGAVLLERIRDGTGRPVGDGLG